MNIQNNKWVGITLLIGTLVFNFWLYRLEPTAKIDPNDNAFQYALIDRTNTIWDYADKTCSNNIICHVSLLTDHWVPNWAQGYNLPYYYSHIPQMLIVGSYRLFHLPISLFQYYHLIIYCFLCLFPLSLFLAFRILKFPWLTAGIAALLASHISTDGLYGIDQTSFLWRGWGLSSQLFALLWFTLTIAYAIRFVTDDNKKGKQMWPLLFSILFLVFTTAGHLGIGMMAFMAIGVICLAPAITNVFTQEPIKQIRQQAWMGIKQLMTIAVPAIVLLSYWIVPAFMKNDFHNISVWDPVWKFNSFGAIEVITKLVNGELFDFGRFPVFTFLVLIGLIACFVDKKAKLEEQKTTKILPLVFLFFLIIFFGKTTFGSLLTIIPGMSEFHGHRFIVGLHLAGLFLAPIGIAWIIKQIGTLGKTPMQILITQAIIPAIIIVSCCLSLFPKTVEYAAYNNTLILQGNTNYEKIDANTKLLFEILNDLEKTRPGRVYALRGNEGKDFRIASTAYYMHLSTYGIPTVLWLPETWSLNSDTEQFFSEDNASHYMLYNIAYVVAPPSKKPQAFWTLIKENSEWILYEVKTEGYIGVGTAPSIIATKKTSLVNIVHLWIQSAVEKLLIYPEVRLTKANLQDESLPRFTMTDEVTYKTMDDISHNLFAEPPMYASPAATPLPITMLSQSEDTDMVFHATVKVTKDCPTCVVVLKETYHPNWQVTVNGKKEKLISVFPLFSALRLETPGTYDIVFSYTPSPVKKILFVGAIVVSIAFVIVLIFPNLRRFLFS